jgi:hypothetical protein
MIEDRLNYLAMISIENEIKILILKVLLTRLLINIQE